MLQGNTTTTDIAKTGNVFQTSCAQFDLKPNGFMWKEGDTIYGVCSVSNSHHVEPEFRCNAGLCSSVKGSSAAFASADLFCCNTYAQNDVASDICFSATSNDKQCADCLEKQRYPGQRVNSFNVSELVT